LGWLAQIGLFVLLGLLVTPSRLPAVVLPALAVTAVLVLLARPLSVLSSLVWFRVPWRDQLFLSWAGLRGAVPIVLATIPVVEGAPGAVRIFDVVFVVVVVSVLLQAPTLPLLARRLGLEERTDSESVEVESTPLGRMGADLLEVHVHGGSRLHGVNVLELRLPQPAARVARRPPGGRRRADPDDDAAPRRLAPGRHHPCGPGPGGPPAPGGERARPLARWGEDGTRSEDRRGSEPVPDRAAVRAAAREAVRGSASPRGKQGP
jgi:NhaP-type Na+/H+ or K+/H+ antiporter